MNNLLDKRISRTKRDLKQAFVELCSKKEVHDISIADIVNHAGYSRATFYAHYDSKMGFMIAFLDDEIDYYINNYVSSYKARNNKAATEKGNEAMFSHVYENKNFYSLLFSDEFQKSLNVREYFLNKVVIAFVSAFDIQFKDDDINRTIDRELYISCVVQTYLMAISYWIKSGFKYSATYMAKQMNLVTKNTAESIQIR